MKGTLFQLQRWCIHDGEGIRTTVFFKGCPLRCAWCANPESWNPLPEQGYGYASSVAQLMAELRKDEAFYRHSGGGVTFSGGEPFFQEEFLRACLCECARRGYDTAVETSGHFVWERAADIFDMLDEVFFDLKHMDAVRHKLLTGQDNGLILENARHVLSSHQNVTVRVPLVPGCNDSSENIRALCEFLSGFPGLRGLEFLPYHNLAASKYATLTLTPPCFSVPEPATLKVLEALARGYGIPVVAA